MNADAYRALGLPADASASEVKRAFRRLALAMHPDVSDDPAHVDIFKQIIIAYEAIIEGKGFTSAVREEPAPFAEQTPTTPSDSTLTTEALNTLIRGWRLATEDLRARTEQSRLAGDQWSASAAWVADTILHQAMKEFESGIEGRRRYGGSTQPLRPLLFDAAERFLEGSQHLQQQPDKSTAANLTRGAMGSVGHARITEVVGATAEAQDKELFARAVMSTLASVLLRQNLIGSLAVGGRGHVSLGPAPIALMEATSIVATYQLGQRHR